MKYGFVILSLLVGSVSMSYEVQASPVNPIVSITPEKCTDTSDKAALELKTMYVVGGDGSNLLSHSYFGDCYGVYDSPNNVGNSYISGNNYGLLGEGLLNGLNGIFDPLTLIDPSQLMDLDNKGVEDDPGWITLLKDDYTNAGWSGAVDSSAYFNITKPNTSNVLNIGSVLEFSRTCSIQDGNSCLAIDWELKTAANIVSEVQNFMGNRSTFDMLAFAFKVGPKWAIFNLDFNKIFAHEAFDHGNVIDNPFETAFGFKGSYTTDPDFPNPKGNNYQGISHFAVFARDPIQTTTIPAPATIAIMGLGLVVIRLFRRR